MMMCDDVTVGEDSQTNHDPFKQLQKLPTDCHFQNTCNYTNLHYVYLHHTK